MQNIAVPVVYSAGIKRVHRSQYDMILAELQSLAKQLYKYETEQGTYTLHT